MDSKFSDPRMENHINGLALNGPKKHTTLDDALALIRSLEARVAALEPKAEEAIGEALGEAKFGE